MQERKEQNPLEGMQGQICLIVSKIGSRTRRLHRRPLPPLRPPPLRCFLEGRSSIPSVQIKGQQ